MGNIEFRKGNKKEAADFWKKACDGDNAEGCGSYGILILYKSEKQKEAIPYINKACNNGNNLACKVLIEKNLNSRK